MATTNPAAANYFNEDEDIYDHYDEEISDHDDDDDSASSFPVAVDRPPPPPTAAAQVTIAVPGTHDPHIRQQLQPPIQPLEIVVAKKPALADESRKLFQRLWNDEDEIELLQGFLDYTTQRFGPNGSSQHHHDSAAFYDQIKSKFQFDFNKNQLVEKLRRLKKKYRNVINRFGSGKECTFKSPHEQATFEISSKIWGSAAFTANCSSVAFRPSPAPVDEEDDDVNAPNFTNFMDCQSPNRNGLDINSKSSRPRKRNRAGAVKVEEKQQRAANINLINSQPSAATPPFAAPAVGSGLAGLLYTVIEDTVKSCLSPIFKELIFNSTSSVPNHKGLCCGNGYGLGPARIPFCLGGGNMSGPIPLCFGAAMGGDKVSSERWRKQQISELEVFSKRLELVQDHIREQLQELRSTGN